MDTSHSFDASNNSGDQDETSVGINRVDKSYICIGANDDGMYGQGMPVYSSTDMGSSWRTHRLPKPKISSFYPLGDPIIATDHLGNFYYAYLAGNDSPDVGCIYIALSQDGIEWSNATAININTSVSGSPDKEHMTVDCSPESPYLGRVYVVWYEFYSSPGTSGQGLNVVWSDDGCKTWSKPTILGRGDNFQEIKTDKFGNVLVSFTSSNDLGQELFVSTDGAKTFAKHRIRSLHSFSNYPLNNISQESLKGFNGFRSFPYVSFDVDLSTNRIHVVYPNFENQSGKFASVLYYTTSDNSGATWSDPKIVGISNPSHSSPNFDRFHPWVTFDQKKKEAMVMYYSSEQDPDNILSAAYRMKLTDEMTDYPEVLHSLFDPTIIEASSNGIPFIGDYTGSDAFDSLYIATWTESGPGSDNGEVYAYISYPKAEDPTKSVGNAIVIHSDKPWLSSPYPNPATNQNIRMNYYLPQSAKTSFDLIDIEGKVIRSWEENNNGAGSYTHEFYIGNIPSGTYIFRMIAGDNQQSRKLIVSEHN